MGCCKKDITELHYYIWTQSLIHALTSHILFLQLEKQDQDLISIKAQNLDLSTRVKDLGHLKDLEASLQSQKWDEFSRLAESMKNLSKTMSKSSTMEFS